MLIVLGLTLALRHGAPKAVNLKQQLHRAAAGSTFVSLVGSFRDHH